MPTDPTTPGALGLEPTYSAQEAAAMLGRSYSWLDQRLRAAQFVLPRRQHRETAADTRRLSAIHPADAAGHRRGERPSRLVLGGRHSIWPFGR